MYCIHLTLTGSLQFNNNGAVRISDGIWINSWKSTAWYNQGCAEQVIKLRKIYWLLGLRFISQSLPEYIEHGVLVQTKVQIRQ